MSYIWIFGSGALAAWMMYSLTTYIQLVIDNDKEAAQSWKKQAIISFTLLVLATVYYLMSLQTH